MINNDIISPFQLTVEELGQYQVGKVTRYTITDGYYSGTKLDLIDVDGDNYIIQVTAPDGKQAQLNNTYEA